jgi:glutamate-1-semialdehyde 2,1-aminomutase
MTAPALSWNQRARARFPAGSNGEYGIPDENVPVIERGAGCRVWDTEGREFLDLTMAWGSTLVGHAHPKVVEAATKAAIEGTNYAAVNRRSVELAERICALSPCAERIRFVASGTEATMLCLRVAHAATGRRKVLRFEGAYHGQHPVGIAGMIHSRPTNLPTCDPAGAGAPWVENDVLVAPFNDLARTSEIIAAHAAELAAVIVEPFHRCLSPVPGFLEGLRAVTRQHGVVLVFDEVVTGFRFALGGAQEYYGVQPDLVAYGKALGGGFPIGAYAGRADLMEAVNEHRLPGPHYAWSASTTGGNPVSCAAALAAIDLFSAPGFYPGLHAAGRKLRERMAAVAREQGEAVQILGDGPLAQVAFSANAIRDQQGWLASNRARGRAVMLELLARGVFLNPMGTKFYLSLAHTDADIEDFVTRFAEAVRVTSPTG